jgi:hypothetical protein
VSHLPRGLSVTTISSREPPRRSLKKLLGSAHFDQVMYGEALAARDVRWLRRAQPDLEVVHIAGPGPLERSA